MIESLHVIWRGLEPGVGKTIIGRLARKAGSFCFWYADHLPAEFGLLPEFPDHRVEAAPYSSGHLFATFAQRVPSPRRPDFSKMLEAWGVQHADDQLEILARSGGIQLTDRIELAEYRSEDDDLSVPLDFRVAGTPYYPGAVSGQISVGDPIELRLEPGNVHDTDATLVLLRDGVKLGHVPRPYTSAFARLLRDGVVIEASAVRLLPVPDDGQRWVARAVRAG
jgi:HIRAN domain